MWIAKRTIAARVGSERIEIRPGEPVPEALSVRDLDELRECRAVERMPAPIADPEAAAEARRVAADALGQPLPEFIGGPDVPVPPMPESGYAAGAVDLSTSATEADVSGNGVAPQGAAPAAEPSAATVPGAQETAPAGGGADVAAAEKPRASRSRTVK